MRTAHSAKNLASSLGLSFIMLILGFVNRKIFVDAIGVEYLGLNGLLSNILGIMTLLEGGFAGSVVYNLYKPMAQNDIPKIIALVQLYRKVYRWIAFGIILVGLSIFPFITNFIKDGQDLQYVSVAYFIFLFNTVFSYFYAYKWSIINVSQQNYKLFVENIVYQVGLSLTKMAILYYTRDYILYLFIESIFGVGLALAVSRKAYKLFPYIKTKIKYVVETDTKKNITTNMKALFLNSLGGYFIHSTDNIVISSFVGVSIVGLYSNYTLITGIFSSQASQIMNSFSESVGNLIASENREKIYDVFKVAFFVNFLVISIPVIILASCLSPIIIAWLGPEYEFGQITVAIILFNFYIGGMRSSALMFKMKSGIYVADRFTPLIQGFINLGASLFLVQYLGLEGVLIATIISIAAIGLWQSPKLIYNRVFHQPLRRYFSKYLLYSSIGLATAALSIFTCRQISFGNSWVNVIMSGFISLLIVGFIYFVTFRRTAEYKELKSYITMAFKSIRNKDAVNELQVVPPPTEVIND